jgi:hypothetical protein
MFPPQPTQDVHEFVLAMASSLQRAGQNLVEVLPEVGKKGKEIYQVRLRLALPLPKAAIEPAIDYIKLYSHESRWIPHRVVIDKRYISLFVSRPRSKASKKR